MCVGGCAAAVWGVVFAAIIIGMVARLKHHPPNTIARTHHTHHTPTDAIAFIAVVCCHHKTIVPMV